MLPRQSLILLAAAILSASCARTPPPVTIPMDPVGVVAPIAAPAPPEIPEPAWDWPAATPEEVGLDSGALADLLESIQAQGDPVDSVVIVRQGRLVLEAYVYPFRQDLRHDLYSCTKSVTSMLVGIAIQEGAIPGVEAPVLGFFPERTIANLDGRKRSLRLEHLLTMSSGFEWLEQGVPYWLAANSGSRMAYSSDPVQLVLDTPVTLEPGTRFLYNTGNSQLLATIVEKSTGMDILSFARKRLFAPLGITDVAWKVDRAGNHAGGGGLQMKPRDLARLGELYLRGGAWEGRQIVPETWVRESVQPRITVSEEARYGYHWWIPADGVYAARGFGDQTLWVVPNLEMVIVVTGGSARPLARNLAERFILPAVKGPGPLPENPEGLARLQARVQELAQPQPRPVPPLPRTAGEVSGRVWEMEENDFGWRSFSLTFGDGDSGDAVLSLELGEKSLKLPIGLDNVFRVTEVEGVGSLAERGAWLDDRTFRYEELWLGQSTRGELRLVFEGDKVEVTATGLDSGYLGIFEGRLASPSAVPAASSGH